MDLSFSEKLKDTDLPNADVTSDCELGDVGNWILMQEVRIRNFLIDLKDPAILITFDPGYKYHILGQNQALPC